MSFLVADEPWELRFAVKFYPPEPAQLQEELTRYQLVLAVRRDLLEGKCLPSKYFFFSCT